jgi:hypothetical protein
MRRLAVVLGAGALIFGTVEAARAQAPSQVPPDATKTVRLAAHNQLGVLEYCQAQGAVDASVVAMQKKMIGMLPAAPANGEDAAESTGKQGIVDAAGQQVALDEAAKAQHTSVAALCDQMGSMVRASAANLPQ